MANRRNVLKMGLLAGGTGLLSKKAAHAQICEPEIGSGDIPAIVSPPTTPFVDPLPIMPVLQPVAQLSPPPNPLAFQLYNQYPPQKLYHVKVQQLQQKFHRDLPTSLMWGYNGIVPGPTILARYGEPVLLRVENQLSADHVGWGLPSVATHLHNMHVGSESDGFPAHYADPGQYIDHHYANFPSGNDPREMMATLWYHDHRMDYTAPNVTRGLAAFYLLFNQYDTGMETGGGPENLRLPSGKYDVPIIMFDRAFDPGTGLQAYDNFNTDGLIGDKYTLNQKIQPFFQVEPRKYRLRFLNGGPSRFLQLFLSNNQQFTLISSDGNLLTAPINVDSLLLSPAERVDAIIDFSRVPSGSSFYLLNRMEQTNGRGPTGLLLDPGDQMMRFDVVLPLSGPDQSQIPDKLIDLPPINMDAVKKRRLWAFDYFNGTWLVNNKTFSPDRVDARVEQGSAEIWTVRNSGTNWSHPIHIHFEEFQMISRNGKPIPLNSPEKGRKDVVRLGPGEEADLYFNFRDFLGRYVMHCHNVVHEDHSMMIRYDCVPPGQGDNQAVIGSGS